MPAAGSEPAEREVRPAPGAIRPVPVASTGMVGDDRPMLERMYFYPNGRLRTRRMLATVVVFGSLALFGSLLLVLTPAWAEVPHAKAIWGIFAVFGLKVPLIVLCGWLILRNKELPGQEVVWSEREVEEILWYLRTEIDRAVGTADEDEHLQYLSGEAWHVADRADGEQKADAVALALKIDAIRRGTRNPRRSR